MLLKFPSFVRRGKGEVETEEVMHPAFSKQSLVTGTGVLGFTLCFLPSAWPAETLPFETLDPVVVTATALPTSQSQTPIRTKVFTRTGFDSQQPNRLGTLLQQTPGISSMKWEAGAASVHSIFAGLIRI